MGRHLDQEVAKDVFQACTALQIRADKAGMKFMSYLLSVAVAQAEKELARPNLRSTPIGKTHTRRLLEVVR